MVRLREYLKRDDQLLVYRLQSEENRNRMAKIAKDRDRALAHANGNQFSATDGDVEMENVGEEADDAAEEHQASKVIVIHPGSQNLRIGLASDALPKTVPMVIAKRSTVNESDGHGGEPKPKRLKSEGEEGVDPEGMFGKEVRCFLLGGVSRHL